MGSQWVFANRLPPTTTEQLYAVYGDPDASASADAVSTERLDAWATKNGGYNIENTNLRLVLQAKTRPVTVVSARAKIIERNPIPTTTLVWIPPEGGADTIKTDLDLDDPRPTAGYFADHTVALQPGEAVTVDLTAQALRSAVVWDLVLDIVVAGSRDTLAVTRSDGLHFRTSGWIDRQHHRQGFAGMNDAPPPWNRYSHGFAFDLVRQRWNRCTAPNCGS